MAGWAWCWVLAGVPTADGGVFPLAPPAGGRAVCLVFVGVDCPISNAYAPEVGRLAGEFSPKGVAFAVAYPNRDVTPAAAGRHAKEFGYPCPAVPDPALALARRVGATTVPEAVVLGPGGAVLYRGRIDDRYPAPGGKRRAHPTAHDLRAALLAVVAGRPVAVPRTRPVGCPIDLGP